MHRLRTFLFLSLTLFAAPAFAATLNVGQGQTYTTIQSAIDAASNGDTVLVFPGTYYEHLNFNGKGITVVSTPVPTGGAANTIIDGSGTGTVVYVSSTSTTQLAILDGFTVQNGYPNGAGGSSSYNYGGAVVVQGNAVVGNNTITKNTSCGVDILNGNVTVQNNHIFSNVGANTAGGDCRINAYGILAHDNTTIRTNINILNNLIEQNEDGGIDIYNLDASTTVNITQNVIRTNGLASPFEEGMGVFLGDFATANVVGNLITGNAGQGVTQYLNSGFILTNNTIYGNSVLYAPAGYYTAGIEVQLGSVDTPAILTNNLIVGTNAQYPVISCYSSSFPPDADHNLIYNAAAQTGSIPCFTDPTAKNLYVDPKLNNPAGSDFHLSAASPAIDAGNNSAPLLPTTDLDGNPRKQDATLKGYPIVDIGAYEYSGIVDTSPTTLTLTLSALNASAGSSITASVNAVSAIAIPTGPITLLEDGVQIGVANLNNSGVATFTISSLKPGFHGLIATYPGQTPFTPAVSVVVIIDVSPYQPTLTLASSANPSILGTPVTFTVSISSPDGAILSPITLTNGGIPLTTLQPNSSGIATYSTSSLAIGYHALVATYASDSTHASAQASLNQDVVNGYTTNTTLTSSLNPSAFGQSVTFTATVTSSNGTPTGSVNFVDSLTTLLQTVPLSNAGVANFTTSALSAGTHTITASFVPTGSFAASAGNLSQGVNGYPTSITAASSLNPSTAGQPVILTATVTNTGSTGGTPAGNILFSLNGSTLQTVPLSAGGQASFTTTALPVGSDNLQIAYVPTGGFNAASTTLTQIVTGITTTTNLSCSPNPIYISQSSALLVLFASVTSTNGIPTGAVSFTDNGVAMPQPAFTAGATATVNGYQFTTPGTHTIVAAYVPSGSFAASSASCSVVVNLDPTTTALTSSLNPSVFSQPVTFTATVTFGPPEVNFATLGTVTFFDGSTPLQTVTVSSTSVFGVGTAAFSTNTLALGTHTITATLNPPGSPLTFYASSSASVAQVITAIPTITNLSASPNPAYQGQSVAITAAITSSAATPSAGTVSFLDSGAVIGTIPVNAAGIAVLTTSTLTLGTHHLLAVYVPDPNGSFLASTSNNVAEVIAVSAFNLTLSPATLTLTAGKTGSTTLQLNSLGLFAGPLTLSFGALPQYATGSLSSSTATLIAGGNASATFAIQTSMLAANSIPPRPGSRMAPVELCTLLVLLPLVIRRRSRLRSLLLVCAAAVFLQTLTGCTTIRTPFHFVADGTYQIPITATDANNNTQTQTLTLIIQ